MMWWLNPYDIWVLSGLNWVKPTKPVNKLTNKAMVTRIQAPHIGQMLKKHVRRYRLFQSGWARQQGVTPKTIATYLKNPTMRIDTLFLICQVLEYNFFTEIARQLPEELPPATKHESEQQLEALKRENEQLKLQIATLKEALGLVGGR